MHQNAFGGRLGPDPLGSYSAPPDSLAAVKRRGRQREKTREREAKGEKTKREESMDGRSTERGEDGEEKRKEGTGNVRGISFIC